MPTRIIDYKEIDMTNEEYDYYQRIVKEFSSGAYSGKEQFRDTFEVDENGCITLIKPPLKKQIAWVVIVFLQNLMINQRLRRVEKRIMEFINDRKTDG